MKLREALINDIPDLQKVCTLSYSKIFADHWTDNGLELYLEQEFGTERLERDLVSEDIGYFFIKESGENIGFLKVKYKSSTGLSQLDNCELEKIYIFPKYSGKGFGKIAMSQVINMVRKKGKALFFLCVIDTNDNAIAFYEKLGFEFHSKTRLEAPYFREKLRGMNRMALRL